MATNNVGGAGAGRGMDTERFEALLEQRFSRADRKSMAREIASHDARGGGPAFDVGHVRRKLHFHGAVAKSVQDTLRAWVPDLLAHAAAQGVRLRDLNHELHVYDVRAYERETGQPLASGMRLPATSYQYLPIAKIYRVNLVLPRAVRTVDDLLGTIRALLSRLLCDIYLREEVFPLEGYREEAPGAVSIGLPETLRLLADEPVTTPRLAAALELHARVIGLNPRRAARQVRESYFRTLQERAAKNALSEGEQGLVQEALATYLAALAERAPARVRAMVVAVEALNNQVNFLPPDELPDYLALREKNPVHYLRAAKLRLEFLLEALGALLEDVERLGGADPTPSPLLEERVEGYLTELRSGGLARPYLLKHVRLSEELTQQRESFPLEVHALLQRLPRTADPERAFKSLSSKLSNSIYQRLYTALVLLQAWLKARDAGHNGEFVASARFEELKALLANFRFRRPLLEALFLRLGVVLDTAEAQGGGLPGASHKLRIPRATLTRAWSQFLPHVLVASFFADGQRVPQFDAPRYRGRVLATLRTQVQAGPGVAHLTYLMHRIAETAGKEGLPCVLEQLRAPSGTWRFVVSQALTAPAGGAEQGAAQRLAQLDEWAALVLRARETTRRNEIRLSDLHAGGGAT